MGDGTDFASYVVARWPALVRTLVLLGLPPDEAEAAAQEGLARCSPAWDRVSREDDVDTWVYRTVLETRGHGPAPDPAAAPGVVDPAMGDLDERAALLEALQSGLARLAPEEREAVVLHFAAGLDTGQVADVLGVVVDLVEARIAAAVDALDVRSLREGSR